MIEQTNTEEMNSVWMVGAGMLVAGLVVGFLIGWYSKENGAEVAVVDDLLNGTSTLMYSTSTVPALSVTYKTIEVSAFVSVDDQRAGSLVFIKHVEISKPTWIAVREIINDSIGNILGASMVTAVTDDVPVTLLRPTKSDGKYAVFLYQDEGDGDFDSKKDLLVMQDGTPVSAMFTAQ